MTIDSERPQETPRHLKAFEIFVALGDGRSYRQVAQQVGVALGTVKRWAKANAWQVKVQERDAHIARQIADRTLNAAIEDVDRKRKLVRAALVRLGQAIVQGKVRMQLSDLDRLIRLDGLLSGHPDGLLGLPESGATSVEQLKAYIEQTPEYIKKKLSEQIQKEAEQYAAEQAERERQHQEAVEQIARQRQRDAGRDTAVS